jgi:hypothetical protein
VGLKLNRTHQFLACADDENLPGDNIDTIKQNIETSIYASSKVGLEINVEKTKYMLLACLQNTGQNRDTETAHILSENVSVQIFGDDSNKSEFDLGGN